MYSCIFKGTLARVELSNAKKNMRWELYVNLGVEIVNIKTQYLNTFNRTFPIIARTFECATPF